MKKEINKFLYFYIIKKDLKLKDRVYRCPHCGAVIDRDLNASLNLSMYKLA